MIFCTSACEISENSFDVCTVSDLKTATLLTGPAGHVGKHWHIALGLCQGSENTYDMPDVIQQPGWFVTFCFVCCKSLTFEK